MKGRIAHIIHRTLRNQVEEYVNFTKRTALVQEYYPSQAEIDLYQQVSDYLMREGTYGVPERQRPLLSLLVRKSCLHLHTHWDILLNVLSIDLKFIKKLA